MEADKEVALSGRLGVGDGGRSLGCGELSGKGLTGVSIAVLRDDEWFADKDEGRFRFRIYSTLRSY